MFDHISVHLVAHLNRHIKINHYSEKLDTFSQRSGQRQWYPLSPLSFNNILEVLNILIRLEKKVKTYRLEGRNNVVCIHISYVENTKELIKKKNPARIRQYSKVAEYKVNTQRSNIFLNASNKELEFETYTHTVYGSTKKKRKIK